MSFLKKLGQILAAGLQVVGVFFPVLKPFLGSGAVASTATTAVNDFTSIGTVIVQIETALQGASGPAKLAAVVPLVTQIVKTSELVAGHQIANEAEFIAGNTDLANAVVRILNSLKADAIKTTGQPNVPAAPPATPTPAASPATPSKG